MLITKEEIRKSLSTISDKPGCYCYRNSDGEIIYVGKAKNLKKRISSYFTKEHPDPKTRALLRHFSSIEYITVETEHDALLLENNLIKENRPQYNILLKEGNRYPYICVTREPFPRLFVTHKVERDMGIYYGPYPDASLPYTLIRLFRRLYFFRTCKLVMDTGSIAEGKHRVCLQYHIKRCQAPCIGGVSIDTYRHHVEEAKRILAGESRAVIAELRSKMQEHATAWEFEQAHELQQAIEALEGHQAKSTIISEAIDDALVISWESDLDNYYVNYLELRHGNIIAGQTLEYRKRLEEEDDRAVIASILQEIIGRTSGTVREIILPEEPDFPLGKEIRITIPQRGDRKRVLSLSHDNVKQYIADKHRQAEKLNPEQRNTQLLRELQAAIGLPRLPYHIECFDNSNTHGNDAVAACVVFRGAVPSKQEYRLYHIREVEGPDDYASMSEVVRRRYSRLKEEGSSLPDLLITDGGRGHMNVVRETLESIGVEIPIVGLAKDDKHHTASIYYGHPPVQVGILQRSQTFFLLTRIQDEVHRFAIKFHRNIRSKRQRTSVLDSIKGIGAATQLTLLKEFKSVKRIKEQPLEVLQATIGKSKGALVYQFFHPQPSSSTP